MARTPDSGDTYAPGTVFIYDPKTRSVQTFDPTPVGTSGNSPSVRDGSTESIPGASGVVGATVASGGGGAGGDAAAAQPSLDWKAYLADWGFPPDVVNELDRIFKTYSDPSQASAASLAYIRGTDWYKTTFPGIQEGEKLGLINNEADYRSYVNNLNQLYQRYNGRAPTSQETVDFLKKGWTPNMVDSHFQGQAYLAANQGDIQYQLGAFGDNGQATPDQLNALGDQVGGLDNGIGQSVQAKLDTAKQRLQKIMQGTLASPSLSVLNNGALASSALGGRSSDNAS